MNYKQFMQAIENYYGKYRNEFVGDIVSKYININYKESELDKLLEKLILKYSNQYKTPPDVAVFNEIFCKNKGRIVIGKQTPPKSSDSPPNNQFIGSPLLNNNINAAEIIPKPLKDVIVRNISIIAIGILYK